MGPMVYGWVFTAHQLGAAAVASAAGIIRTVTGGYELAFIGSGALCLLAASLSLLIRRGGGADPRRPRWTAASRSSAAGPPSHGAARR